MAELILMTLNEFMADLAGHELTNYIENKYYDNEISLEEMDEYFECEYERHLDYLIETWSNYIDGSFVSDFKIDYNRQGTFKQLFNYFHESPCPLFEDRWIDDIFVRHMLVRSAVCLK